MDEARRQRITHHARELLEQAGVTAPPVPVERLARLRGATLRYVPHRGDMSGMLCREKGHVLIGVNSLHPAVRQRFTIAHELGHLQLHGDAERLDKNFRVQWRDRRSALATDPEEIEANRFAAELLMPEDLLVRDLEGRALDMVDDEFLGDLARRYQVSLQALILRLTRLGFLEAS